MGNDRSEQQDRGRRRRKKAKVSRRTLEHTFKKKYDAIVHRRQTKGTGSKDKNSIWAITRNCLSKQLLMLLGFTGEKTVKAEPDADASSPKPDSSKTDQSTANPTLLETKPDPSPPQSETPKETADTTTPTQSRSKNTRRLRPTRINFKDVLKIENVSKAWWGPPWRPTPIGIDDRCHHNESLTG